MEEPAGILETVELEVLVPISVLLVTEAEEAEEAEEISTTLPKNGQVRAGALEFMGLVQTDREVFMTMVLIKYPEPEEREDRPDEMR